MSDLKEAVADFLSQKRLAVAGVSREGGLPGNHIFRKLAAQGYEVFPVNPRAREVEGVQCFPDLSSISPPVQGVVVATPPDAVEVLVRECIRLGIPRVWLHRSFGVGSFSQDSVDLCRSAGISVIPGACPMMYLEPVDLPHRCFRWILGIGGKLPVPSGFEAEN